MSSDTDQQLARRFGRLLREVDDPDWSDVRRRFSRRRRQRARRGGGALAVGLVAVAIAAPALGLPSAIVDWFSAEPASPRVQTQFAELPSAPNADVASDFGSARKVAELSHGGVTYVLAVAPTGSGGFCYEWSDLFGGCQQRRDPPATQPHRDRYLLGASWASSGEGFIEFVGGSVLAPGTRRIVAKFADGAELEMPLTWVSAPINAGFYLLFVPPQHQASGHELTAIEARDDSGRLLARQQLKG